jgi:hypothetical protein
MFAMVANFKMKRSRIVAEIVRCMNAQKVKTMNTAFNVMTIHAN